MFLQPHFSVTAAPVDSAVIQQALDRATRIRRINSWLFVPGLVLVFHLAWTATNWAADFSQMNPGIFHKWFAFITCIWSLVVGVSALFGWTDYWNKAVWRLRPIDINRAERALQLTAYYPQLEAWRIAITANRKIVNGELDAMERFASETEVASADKRREMENLAAFQKLHQSIK